MHGVFKQMLKLTWKMLLLDIALMPNKLHVKPLLEEKLGQLMIPSHLLMIITYGYHLELRYKIPIYAMHIWYDYYRYSFQ